MANHSFLACVALAIVFISGMAGTQAAHSANSFTYEGFVCLAANVYHEARGESLEGQRAVADVTLNRVSDHRWPNTLCAVVWQSRQFSWTQDRISDDMTDAKARAVAYQIAWEALTTQRVYDATHYHATHIRPYWAKHMIVLVLLGNHIFYI